MAKLRLWNELSDAETEDGAKSLAKIDIYTGRVIGFDKLFSDEIEIEHILPFSRTYDNSMNDKTITFLAVNRRKGNPLPYDFALGDDHVELYIEYRAAVAGRKTDAIGAIKNEMSRKRAELREQTPVNCWNDFLKWKAENGDEIALKVLRSKKEPIQSIPSPTLDSSASKVYELKLKQSRLRSDSSLA
ncbi:HNH endonuclease domain-containing protein [Maridesulfovibrio sp.]|uniref:HNH endonuclease domain-containing protein n=1 Tax=Maridesulfovibrio sp. TaxID=2795000 RepID=UPI0039EF6773